jgi:hypothetical protein
MAREPETNEGEKKQVRLWDLVRVRDLTPAKDAKGGGKSSSNTAKQSPQIIPSNPASPRNPD